MGIQRDMGLIRSLTVAMTLDVLMTLGQTEQPLLTPIGYPATVTPHAFCDSRHVRTTFRKYAYGYKNE